MRRVFAYLIACSVAGLIAALGLLLRLEVGGEIFASVRDFKEFIFFIPVFALVVGIVMLIPSIAMIAARRGMPVSLGLCTTFGGISGGISLLVLGIFSEGFEVLNPAIDLLPNMLMLLTYILAGIAAGATYWAIAERNQT